MTQDLDSVVVKGASDSLRKRGRRREKKKTAVANWHFIGNPLPLVECVTLQIRSSATYLPLSASCSLWAAELLLLQRLSLSRLFAFMVKSHLFHLGLSRT